MNAADVIVAMFVFGAWVLGLMWYCQSDMCKHNYDTAVRQMWITFQVVLWMKTAILVLLVFLACAVGIAFGVTQSIL